MPVAALLASVLGAPANRAIGGRKQAGTFWRVLRFGHGRQPQAPARPLMDLANMREQGVTHLIAFCHN
jgi:hypothetical protein